MAAWRISLRLYFTLSDGQPALPGTRPASPHGNARAPEIAFQCQNDCRSGAYRDRWGDVAIIRANPARDQLQIADLSGQPRRDDERRRSGRSDRIEPRSPSVVHDVDDHVSPVVILNIEDHGLRRRQVREGVLGRPTAATRNHRDSQYNSESSAKHAHRPPDSDVRTRLSRARDVGVSLTSSRRSARIPDDVA